MSQEAELSDRDAMGLSDSEAVDEAVIRNYILQKLTRWLEPNRLDDTLHISVFIVRRNTQAGVEL